MPAVTVRSSPKGFPIATTGSPTSTSSELPSGSGVSARDRDDGVADADAVGVAERERSQAARARLHAEDGEVGRGVAADDPRLHLVALREPDLDVGGALDDVEIRDDVPVLVDDEPRAERRTAWCSEGSAESRVGPGP
jgi:hypothetical protein